MLHPQANPVLEAQVWRLLAFGDHAARGRAQLWMKCGGFGRCGAGGSLSQKWRLPGEKDFPLGLPIRNREHLHVRCVRCLSVRQGNTIVGGISGQSA